MRGLSRTDLGGRRRPRVLLAVTLAEVGGAQSYVAMLARGLAPRVELTVAAHGNGPLREEVEALGVRWVPLRHVRRAVHPWRDLLGLVELVRLLRRLRPDVVHLNSSKATILGRVAAVCARTPVRVVTAHGWAFSWHSGSAAHAFRWLERLLAPAASAIIAVSESERRAGVHARACSPARTVVIPNAVDVPAAPPATPAGGSGRIISVGRLAPPKDFLTLLQALAMVEEPFSTLVVGQGPQGEQVERELERLGLTEKVTLAGQRHDVPHLLADAELFVLATRSEGMPLSVLEAMAAGLPVVASAVGGIPELVVHGRTGLLVPSGDARSLADALERLLRDPGLRERMGDEARRLAEQRFDRVRLVADHVELYARLLRARGLPEPVPREGPVRTRVRESSGGAPEGRPHTASGSRPAAR